MHKNWYISQNTIRNVARIAGEKVEYDFCDTGQHLTPQNHLTECSLYLFLGTGVIHSIDGVIQKNANTAYHFWKIIPLAKIKQVF